MKLLRLVRFATLIATTVGSSTAFATLTKTEAYELMKQHGFRWKQTETVQMDAEAKKQMAQSAFYPHFNAYSREYLGKVNQIQYGFSDPGTLTWFTAGTTGIIFGYNIIDVASVARLKAAEANEKMTQEQKTQYQSDLTYLMLLQYLNVQRLKKNIEIIDSTLERDNSILQIAEKRLNMGIGVNLDVARAHGLVERDQFKKLDAKTSLFKACQELGTTLGTPEVKCDLEPLTARLISEDTLLQKHAPTTAGRADLKAAQLAITAAEHLREFEDKDSLPKLQFFGDMGVFGTHVIGGVGNAVTGMIGLQVTFPVWDGGYRSGKVEEEQVKVVQATTQEQQLQIEARSQVDIAVSQLKDSRAAVDVSLKGIDIAKQELSFSEKKFRSGASSSLEVSNSQANLSMAYDNNVQATFAYEVAKINYFKAVGQLSNYFEFDKSR